MSDDTVLKQICPALPGPVRRAVEQMCPAARTGLNEIRLRKGRQVCAVIHGADVCLSASGETSSDCVEAAPLIATDAMMAEAVRLVTASSLYALQREISQGYVTLPGGHRVGMVGRVVTDAGFDAVGGVNAARVRTQTDIASLNYRIARSMPGVADAVMSLVLRQGVGDVRVLVVSPPGDGKTTLLRDIARQLASGAPGRPPVRVGIVDERSEIAAGFAGMPGHDIGLACDVIEGCPKPEGISMLIRSMAPKVIITDEIGGAADADALFEASRSGVGVVASAHAASWEQVTARPMLAAAAGAGAFHTCLTLTRRAGVVLCHKALDVASGRNLLQRPAPLVATGGAGGVSHGHC